MEQTLRLWMGFYRQIGATQKSMRAAFAAADKNAARKPYRMSEAKAFEIFRSAGDLIDTWYREANYVDDVGIPRVLPLHGPNGFETLSKRYLPDHSPEEVARFLADVGVVTRLANGGLKVHRRTPLIHQLNAVTLDRYAVLTHGLSETLLWNFGGRGHAQPRLERQVHATHLPVGLIPEFNAKTKEVGALAIGQIENWLASRNQPASPSSATARVGVNLVAYVEESTPVKLRRPSQPRRRRP